MEVVRIDHIDFELIVKCNNFERTFQKAFNKQKSLLTCTSYEVSEGKLLYAFYPDFKLKENLSKKTTNPVFFENKEYFFSIRFKDKNEIEKPFIFSKTKEFEEKFFYEEEIGFLAGTVNFGNDIGKSSFSFKYSKSSIIQKFTFEFEVFPIKLDYKNDYLTILNDISNEYSYLVFDFLKKTYSNFKTGGSNNTDLIWWQIFGGLYSDFIAASKFILNRPHHKIIPKSQYVRADKIKVWNSSLEEKYLNYSHLPNKLHKTSYKELTTDTLENRFLKYSVTIIESKYRKIKDFIERRYSHVITDAFKVQLNEIGFELNALKNNQFFKSVGNYSGIRQESLVLQKATGYSTVYKSWIMLKKGIEFFEGSQELEMKNVAELYQIWCFLKIKNMLQKILKKDNPDEIDLAEITGDKFLFKIQRGLKSKVSFITEKGDIIDLYHDLSFDLNKGEVKSYTVNQRPDIVLKITRNELMENYSATYLFDAKYRIASDLDDSLPDLPTDDSINQMHRYRDAIYYVNKENNKPEKEVIGGFILFPGAGDTNAIKQLDYYKSIDKVNIGAFPLLPDNYQTKELLENYLKSILDIDTENALKEIIPHKKISYQTVNPSVLIGFVPSDEHAKCFEFSKMPFYYSGKNKPSRFGFNNLKYFAPYIKGKGIKEFYEILSYDIIERDKILNAPNSDDNSERLVIWLGEKRSISNGNYFKISNGSIGQTPYRYTNFKNIRNPVEGKIEVMTLKRSK
ncbi:DUF2357 domain-containing protein [Sinomicrobium sp. M5D2P9]